MSDARSTLVTQHENRKEWAQQHFDSDVVFLGDSITESWAEQGQVAWGQYFGGGGERNSNSQHMQVHKALNLAIMAEEVQHLTWR